MTADVSTSDRFATADAADRSGRRLAIGFMNLAHGSITS